MESTLISFHIIQQYDTKVSSNNILRFSCVTWFVIQQKPNIMQFTIFHFSSLNVCNYSSSLKEMVFPEAFLKIMSQWCYYSKIHSKMSIFVDELAIDNNVRIFRSLDAVNFVRWQMFVAPRDDNGPREKKWGFVKIWYVGNSNWVTVNRCSFDFNCCVSMTF